MYDNVIVNLQSVNTLPIRIKVIHQVHFFFKLLLPSSAIFFEMSASSGGYIVTGSRKFPHVCSYCHKDITMLCVIKCADPVCVASSENGTTLCADCFAAGVNLPPYHVCTHSYRVADCLEQWPIFHKDWSANEELTLLEGMKFPILNNNNNNYSRF